MTTDSGTPSTPPEIVQPPEPRPPADIRRVLPLIAVVGILALLLFANLFKSKPPAATAVDPAVLASVEEMNRNVEGLKEELRNPPSPKPAPIFDPDRPLAEIIRNDPANRDHLQYMEGAPPEPAPTPIEPPEPSRREQNLWAALEAGGTLYSAERGAGLSRQAATAAAPAESVDATASTGPSGLDLSQIAAVLPNPQDFAQLASLGAGTGLAAPPAAAAAPDLSPSDSVGGVELPPNPETTLRAGTLVSAALVTELNSDAPGPVLARVTRDLHTPGGRVLVPRGALLIGKTRPELAADQRVLVVFSQLRHAGATIHLPGGDALDSMGAYGARDLRRSHFLAALGKAGALSAVSAGISLSQPEQTGSLRLSDREIVTAEVGLGLNRVITQILQDDLQRRPTLIVRPGTQIQVWIARDLELL